MTFSVISPRSSGWYVTGACVTSPFLKKGVTHDADAAPKCVCVTSLRQNSDAPLDNKAKSIICSCVTMQFLRKTLSGPCIVANVYCLLPEFGCAPGLLSPLSYIIGILSYNVIEIVNHSRIWALFHPRAQQNFPNSNPHSRQNRRNAALARLRLA